jgi:hypothetical protein
MGSSRVAFTTSFLLAMATPLWKTSTFAHWPLFSFRLSGSRFQVGALVLLPVLAVGCWAMARLLQRPRRRWRWGPAHIALPVFGFSALTLARVWPIHIAHTAVVTVVAISLFLAAYLYVLQDWPERWAVASLACLILFQGTVATIQFLRQGSAGLLWMGEPQLDPQGQGVSVIGVAGVRWMRAYGLTPHPNVLGGYLCMSTLACLGAMGSLPVRFRRWLGVCIAVGGMALFFTFSRAAWLGTLTGLCYLAGMTRPWRTVHWRASRTRWAIVLSSAALILVLVVLMARYGDLVITRFFRLRTPLEERAIRERIEDVGQAWSLIRIVPLKGTGPGYYVGALWARVGENRPPGFRKVHSVPVLAAAELGIGGAILWLWLLLSPPLVLASRASRAVFSARRAGWAAAFLSATVLSVFDNYLYIPSTWWPAMYLGVFAGVWARVASNLGEDT